MILGKIYRGAEEEPLLLDNERRSSHIHTFNEKYLAISSKMVKVIFLNNNSTSRS